MKKFGIELHQNKKVMFINKRIVAVLLSFMAFTIPCYASEIQEPISSDVFIDCDGTYTKILSFKAQSNLFYLEEYQEEYDEFQISETFEVSHCPYVLENGMIMIPLRDLFDVIQKAEKNYKLTHCSLIWHENTKQIECHVGQRHIRLWTDDSKFSVNGEEARQLDYSLINKDGIIYISLKDIAPMLGNSFFQNFYDIENNRFRVWLL